MLGVQWHPEFMVLTPGQQRLFRALAEAARQRRKDPPVVTCRRRRGGTG